MSSPTIANKIVTVHDPNWDSFAHAAHAIPITYIIMNARASEKMYSVHEQLYYIVHYIRRKEEGK